MRHGVVIAGGGLAAQRCAEALRRKGYDGPMRMVCAEPHPPYDRPPLSKELLAGACGSADLAFRPDAWYADHDVRLELGRPAIALRPRERALVLERGATLNYDQLLVATGSRPRRLAALAGNRDVHVLRSLDDALRLRGALMPGARLAVVGAGFVGQEVAATARRLGVEVTLIEAAPLPLVHVLGARLARWLAGMHRDEGVRVLLDARVERRRGQALELDDGRRVPADAVLVAVGVEPATKWLPKGWLEAPAVHAAGDATGGQHWDAAARQGVAAAHRMLGVAPAAPPPPSFWSDQYGVRLQLVGDTTGHDAFAVDGDPAARDFHAVFHRAGRPVAGLAVNRPHELPRLRRLLSDQERQAA